MLWDACCYSIAITTNSATATNRPFWHTHWDRVHRADTIDQVNTFSLTHTPTSLKTVQMKNSEIANECNESSFHDFLNKWVFHNFCFISKVFGCFVVVVVLLLKCIFFFVFLFLFVIAASIVITATTTTTPYPVLDAGDRTTQSKHEQQVYPIPQTSSASPSPTSAAAAIAHQEQANFLWTCTR